jgi:hypothetical protein
LKIHLRDLIMLLEQLLRKNLDVLYAPSII